MSITDNIISAVTKAIYEEFHKDFGDNMLIAKENVEQGLEPNSFAVYCPNPLIRKDLDILYKTDFLINVCFFPDMTSNTINSTLYDVSERLDNIFEVLKVNNDLSILGANPAKNISDEKVLSYAISFNTRMPNEIEKEEKMKELIINQEVKNG